MNIKNIEQNKVKNRFEHEQLFFAFLSITGVTAIIVLAVISVCSYPLNTPATSKNIMKMVK